MSKEKNIVVGFDVGGAHLKVVRAEGGRIVAAQTYATPLWQGLSTLEKAFAESVDICAGAASAALTMTGELADVFSSRQDGVHGLLDIIERETPVKKKRIYAVRSGLVEVAQARNLANDVASANWHATASLVGRLAGDALFVDMGSTTTDLIPVRDGAVSGRGYSDAERLQAGELVYTGFTRTFLMAVTDKAPVAGRFTPLMNEYFASTADVHRILGVLEEADDKHATADGKEKTVAASTLRLARTIGYDAAGLPDAEWRTVAVWFSEEQLRSIHDAATLHEAALPGGAPVVAAGTGRWQIRRLAARLERPYVDLADLIPADKSVRNEASNAAAATAVALLNDGRA
ncbi:MAG: hydantoinase/oxoprolinase family protein [Rhizobiaceae bacterium]